MSSLDRLFSKNYWPIRFEAIYRGYAIRLRRDCEGCLWGEIDDKLAFILKAEEGDRPSFEWGVSLARAWVDRKVKR